MQSDLYGNRFLVKSKLTTNAILLNAVSKSNFFLIYTFKQRIADMYLAKLKRHLIHLTILILRLMVMDSLHRMRQQRF